MPNRIIRESCRTSESLNTLSTDLGAEAFFWRLTTVADDFGRFVAEANILLSTCFPCRPRSVKEVHVGKWMQMLAQANIVKFYEKDGRTYGYFPSWEKHQGKPRARQSKCPDPGESANICLHMSANVLVSESESENRIREAKASIGAEAALSPPARKCKQVKRGFPDGFGFNAKHEIIAQGFGLNVHNEFLKFRDTSLAKGYEYVDWEAAFRNWLNKAVEFREARR